jgi:hypothetical protein
VPVEVVGKERTGEVRIPGALRSAAAGSAWVPWVDVEGVETAGLRAVLARGTERLRKDIVVEWMRLNRESYIFGVEVWNVASTSRIFNFYFPISPSSLHLDSTISGIESKVC